MRGAFPPSMTGQAGQQRIDRPPGHYRWMATQIGASASGSALPLPHPPWSQHSLDDRLRPYEGLAKCSHQCQSV